MREHGVRRPSRFNLLFAAYVSRGVSGKIFIIILLLFILFKWNLKMIKKNDSNLFDSFLRFIFLLIQKCKN